MSATEMSETSEVEVRRGTIPLVAVLFAWIVPGAGHLYLGRRRRAISFFCLVLVSLIVGVALEGRLWVMAEGNPISTLATLACMGMGLPYFVLRFGFAYQGDMLGPGWEYGAAFITTAGLMNLLLILDAWDIARGVKD